MILNTDKKLKKSVSKKSFHDTNAAVNNNMKNSPNLVSMKSKRTITIYRQKSESTLKILKNIDSSDSTDNTKNEAKLLQKGSLNINQYFNHGSRSDCIK